MQKYVTLQTKLLIEKKVHVFFSPYEFVYKSLIINLKMSEKDAMNQRAWKCFISDLTNLLRWHQIF